MFKSILIFIKAHAVATAVTTVAVVGTAVAAPIAVNNYMLDQQVKQNLAQHPMTKTITRQDENGEEITEEVPAEPVVSDEPLTFKIEVTDDEEYNPDGSLKWKSRAYDVVPSYNKDFSKWTKKEKEEYQRMHEEAVRMGEEYYQQTMANEEQALKDAEAEIEKISNSFTKDYSFTILSENGTISFELWKYNTMKNTYAGDTWIYEGKVTEDIFGISASDFKRVVYPSLKQKISTYVTNREKLEGPMPTSMKKEYEEEQQKMYAELEELVGLSH